jgi:hypothetical protein
MKKFAIVTALFLLGMLAGVAHGQIAAPTVTQVVTAPLINPASFTLTSTPNPSLTTQAVTYTGALTGPSGDAVPTGTITVCDGGTWTPGTGTTAGTCTGGISVATVTLAVGTSSATYTCTENGMTAGTHIISAHYTPAAGSIYAASN